MITLSDEGLYVVVHTIRCEAGALPIGARVNVDDEDLENLLDAGAIKYFDAPAPIAAEHVEPEPAHEPLPEV